MKVYTLTVDADGAEDFLGVFATLDGAKIAAFKHACVEAGDTREEMDPFDWDAEDDGSEMTADICITSDDDYEDVLYEALFTITERELQG